MGGSALIKFKKRYWQTLCLNLYRLHLGHIPLGHKETSVEVGGPAETIVYHIGFTEFIHILMFWSPFFRILSYRNNLADILTFVGIGFLGLTEFIPAPVNSVISCTLTIGIRLY